MKYQVDEYVATIFPGNNGQQSGMVKESLDNTGKGKVIFEGLEGGTVEYVITGLRNYFVHWANYLVGFLLIIY